MKNKVFDRLCTGQIKDASNLLAITRFQIGPNPEKREEKPEQREARQEASAGSRTQAEGPQAAP